MSVSPAARAAEEADALRARGVPFSVSRAIIATFEPHEPAVREAVVEAGQRLHVILNKGSIMVLPTGVDKATGLRHSVAQLGIHPESVVGIGDAENDIEFLAACGCGVAVANALPSLKLSADFVTGGTHGDGVAEIIDSLLRDGRLPCNGRERRLLVPE
jgi:hydroxymethylpyrimidine pyrophosphatase-like HAD family hydrolase